MNLSYTMALFEHVHRRALIDAYNNLHRLPSYGRWRIALVEQLTPLLLDEKLPSDICYVVDLALDHQGKLQVADAASQKAIEDWERRYHDAAPYMFEIPMLVPGGD